VVAPALAQALALVGVGLGVMAPLLFLVTALALIPFGGTYALGARSVTLVLAPVESAVLLVVALCALATLGPFRVRGRATLPANDVLDRVAHRTAYATALGLTLVPIFMIYGTTDLGRIGAAQDAQFTALGVLEAVGVNALPLGIERITAPLWGLVLNPAAFVLYFACAMQMTRKPRPRPREIQEAVLIADPRPASSPYADLLTITGLLQQIVIAALATALFLGGWTIPWLDQATLIDGAAPYVGPSVATLLCALLHVAAFFAKVLCLVLLQIQLRASRMRLARLTRIGWRWIVAASLLNILATAAIILSFPIEGA